ncbi:NAD(P)-dependent oxidoreductase [Roseibacillus persicicus]|uniref:NAD(P)-dependent oxidoreductase n=1 Tax=Roseibacillus persicicus TaxID=454148 RepID=UPI00280CA88F|nr:NAD(P)-dependent oxidoreductase [Roseibacillus persicicus]MDQ8192489.1 NAD(P)-dependent oxidoreductase [Roseibacillus persicicus]
MKTVAFVGVGRMGANMARHLKLDCGYDVTAVYDVNREAAESLAEELGSKVAETLPEVTAAADIIFTVVTNDDAMRGIFLGSDGLLEGADGKTFINCATLSPGIHGEVAEAGQAAGAEVLEAAMASSISQAREGSLYLMIGGEESVFESNKKLLEDLSINLRHCGPIGKAAEVKALVNMVMNINTAGLAEGLGLAEALGLDLAMVREVFSQTGANSRVLETDAEDMVARDHDCWFSAEHAAKDSGIASDLAVAAGLNLPVNNATRAQYDVMVAKGLGGLDKSGIAELTFKGRGN